ncbi:MAG: type II secretion system GspH family protein [Holosporales bacterium]|nr:type II secretion system GspH family protein [Holosporales bacterium]
MILGKKLKGFILIETAVALCVIGVLASIIIPSVKTLISASKILRTRHSLDFVLQSLSVHAKVYDRLPWPATDNSGLENECNHVIGKIPYKALCIEEQVQKDGYQRDIIYIVNPILTTWIPKTPFDDKEIAFTKIQGPNNMHVVFEDGSPVLSCDAYAVATDFCAVVLISIHPTSSYSLDDIVTLSGSDIKITIPQKAPGVIVRWISRNNLFVLCGQF